MLFTIVQSKQDEEDAKGTAHRIKQHELPSVCVAICVLWVEVDRVLQSAVCLFMAAQIAKGRCGHPSDSTVSVLELI